MLAFYIALSLSVSFLCSLLEAIILSVSPSYLTSLKATNPKLYAKVSDLKEDIEKPLASILSFNTIAHTIGAAGAGAEAQKAFGSEILTVFSILLTLAILFLSEIIPKSIGAGSWRALLPFAVKVLRPMIFLSAPLVYVSQILGRFFQGEKEVVSREEIKALADIGLSDGVLSEHEHRSLKGLVKFSKLKLKDVISKKEEVKSLTYDMNIEIAYNEIQEHSYSRIIVFGVDKDDLRGYVMRNEIQRMYIEGYLKENLNTLIKPILRLPHDISTQNLFHRLLKRREHISAVIDDHGQFMGIITLEDLIEHMLDLEIFDEFD